MWPQVGQDDEEAKSLESRQESAIQEKAALLHDVERAEPLKLAPRAFHSARLLELDRVSIDVRGRACVRRGQLRP